jgi:hypothetical protein
MDSINLFVMYYIARDAYNYRPISAQSLIRKMLSLTRYFSMYTDNTQIMSD